VLAHITTIESVSSFKTALKKFLFADWLRRDQIRHPLVIVLPCCGTLVVMSAVAVITINSTVPQYRSVTCEPREFKILINKMICAGTV